MHAIPHFNNVIDTSRNKYYCWRIQWYVFIFPTTRWDLWYRNIVVDLAKKISTQITYNVQYNIVIIVLQAETQINNRKTSYCYRGAATFWNASTATGVLRVLFFITALALRIHKIIIIPNFVTINLYKKILYTSL